MRTNERNLCEKKPDRLLKILVVTKLFSKKNPLVERMAMKFWIDSKSASLRRFFYTRIRLKKNYWNTYTKIFLLVSSLLMFTNPPISMRSILFWKAFTGPILWMCWNLCTDFKVRVQVSLRSKKCSVMQLRGILENNASKKNRSDLTFYFLYMCGKRLLVRIKQKKRGRLRIWMRMSMEELEEPVLSPSRDLLSDAKSTQSAPNSLREENDDNDEEFGEPSDRPGMSISTTSPITTPPTLPIQQQQQPYPAAALSSTRVVASSPEAFPASIRGDPIVKRKEDAIETTKRIQESHEAKPHGRMVMSRAKWITAGIFLVAVLVLVWYWRGKPMPAFLRSSSIPSSVESGLAAPAAAVATGLATRDATLIPSISSWQTQHDTRAKGRGVFFLDKVLARWVTTWTLAAFGTWKNRHDKAKNGGLSKNRPTRLSISAPKDIQTTPSIKILIEWTDTQNDIDRAKHGHTMGDTPPDFGQNTCYGINQVYSKAPPT